MLRDEMLVEGEVVWVKTKISSVGGGEGRRKSGVGEKRQRSGRDLFVWAPPFNIGPIDSSRFGVQRGVGCDNLSLGDPGALSETLSRVGLGVVAVSGSLVA